MISRRNGIRLIIGLSVFIALMSMRFLVVDLTLGYPDFLEHIAHREWAFLAHIGGASLALMVGALQLVKSIRLKRPVIHRWLGRVYVLAILAAGAGGLVLAVNAVGGAVAAWGFGLLAVLWVVFTVQGYRLARSRRFAEHERWMIRSFALTFAAVTLRLYLLFFTAFGFGYAEASVYLAWMCWVPNMLVVEWWLRRKSEG